MGKDELRGPEMTSMALLAPVQGWFGPLSEAPDPVFASGMMGEGGLIDPVAGELRAPCDGVIVNVPDSLHALTLRTGNGAEILIHVGIETVALKGEGFTAHVAEGDAVAAGDLLLSFDLDALAEKAVSLQTPIVIANEGYRLTDIAAPGPVRPGDCLFRIVAAGTAGTVEEIAAETVSRYVTILLGNGIHARPAARLADIAKKFKAAGWLHLNGKKASVRSPVALMTLDMKHGDKVEAEAAGEGAEALLDALVEAVESGLGEEIVPLTDFADGVPPSTPEISTSASVALDGSVHLCGVTGAPGLAIGPVVRIGRTEAQITEEGGGPETERAALAAAVGKIRARLTASLAGGQSQQDEIVKAHLTLLDDEMLGAEADALIAKGKSAAYAWRAAIRIQIAELQALGNPLLAERAGDLADIEEQVIAVLSGREQRIEGPAAGSIVVAEEVYPSQFIRLAEAGIAGICLTQGGPTSHVSILAGEKGIPALVAMEGAALTIPDGTSVILNADKGALHVAPTPTDITATEDAIRRKAANLEAALREAGETGATEDGTRIEVFANLGGEQGAKEAVALGAEGCGLLRTEFLYMGRATPPDEAEQAETYQSIADGLAGQPLVIRTLDIGGDKPAPFVQFDAEENPALGLRGVRLTLKRRDLMEAQLRAILRVETASRLHVMLPMVVSAGEIVAVREAIARLEAEMGLSRNLPVGIMVETPASAVAAETLARHADFFSIGTNDLSQYVLAMDRGNPGLAAQVDGFHPAVLRMIAMTTEAGLRHGKWVGVCGSMASHPLAVPILTGLGVTELSATPRMVPVVKAILRGVTMEACRAVAQAALDMEDPEAVRAHVLSVWPNLQDWI